VESWQRFPTACRSSSFDQAWRLKTAATPRRANPLVTKPDARQYTNSVADTYNIKEAQASLPKLCRSGKREGFNRLRIGGLRVIYHQISGKEILLEYGNTRDAVYELYERILENRNC